ncbi:MAG TPA: hypothetical protein VG711_12300 [Phycisphaerales bacterium]|nr:hypothetical protein [Phycisphaerales bacterium]
MFSTTISRGLIASRLLASLGAALVLGGENLEASNCFNLKGGTCCYYNINMQACEVCGEEMCCPFVYSTTVTQVVSAQQPCCWLDARYFTTTQVTGCYYYAPQCTEGQCCPDTFQLLNADCDYSNTTHQADCTS